MLWLIYEIYIYIYTLKCKHFLNLPLSHDYPGRFWALLVLCHTVARFQNAEFDWSETLQGHILGSFYYGYVVAQIPGGILAQKYGGKHVFGIGILLTGILTLLTPIAARMGPGYMIAVRVLEGIGEVSDVKTCII